MIPKPGKNIHDYPITHNTMFKNQFGHRNIIVRHNSHFSFEYDIQKPVWA